MNRLVALLAVAVVTAFAGVAHAAPIEVDRGGDHVQITVAGVTAAGAPVAGDGEIDIPLTSGAKVASYIRLEDATVRKVELGDASTPRLRIKTRTGRRGTEAIAAGLVITPSANGLTISVPREAAAPIKPVAAKVAAKPELKAEAKPELKADARPLEAARAIAKATEAEAARPAPTKPEAAPTKPEAAPTKPEAATIKPEAATIKPEAAPTAAPAAPAITSGDSDLAAPTPSAEPLPPALRPVPEKPATPITLAETPRSLPWTSIIVVIGVVAGVALVIKRTRDQRAGGELPRMTMRAQMSLGGRSRVILLTADERELLVAVDSKGVHLLDSWNRNEPGEGGEAVVSAADFDDELSSLSRPRIRAVTRTNTSIPTANRTGTAIPVIPADDGASRANRSSALRLSGEESGPVRTRAATMPPRPRLGTEPALRTRGATDAARPRTNSDQVSGLLRLRHAVTAEDVGALEPRADEESPWAEHLLASLRRGKPS